MQDALVDMDPISLIITSVDVKGAFPNTPHRLLLAVWKRMGLPFQGFLQAYLATRMYAVKTDVGTTPWPFLFLLVTLPLAFYIRRTYQDVGTLPPTDHAPSIRGRHGGGNRHRRPAPANHLGHRQGNQSTR